MHSHEFVLGIDGGGTKTVAWLAPRLSADPRPAVGRGIAGPSNPQVVGLAKAMENLDRAIAAAFDDAGAQPGTVAAAVLALAGSERQQNRRALQRWAQERHLAQRFCVVNDAMPVLVAGTPQCWGVALIAGTGSLAFGRSRDGQTSRAGGWGFLFGDEGSAYAIALSGLRAAAKSADGRAPPTQLLPALLGRLGLKEPQELISAIYPIAGDRAAIAALADVVTKTAEGGDGQAQEILDEAAGDLAGMVAAVAQNLGFACGAFPLVLSGGTLLGSQDLQKRLQARLGALGVHPEPISRVTDPVAGAVMLAQSEAQNPAPPC